MHVLVIRNAFTYDFGGAERLAVHIARDLNLSKIQTTVVSRQPRVLEYAKTQSVTAYRGWWWSHQDWSGKWILGVPLYVLWQLLLTVWYIQLILRLKPDAVHALSKDDFIAATLAGRLLGKPVVWTDCADLKHVLAKHRVWYKNPVGKMVYAVSKLARAVTLVSNSEKELIQASLGGPVPANYVVVHIAGKDEQVTPFARQRSDEKAVIFCATSRLVIAKGIGELIEAFVRLSKELPGVRLWLVGDGPDEARFQKLAGNNKQIWFIGHSETPLVYAAAADVFVHPTHHEGFSLSLAEAAMLGKPMIATNVGGNPELVNNTNGILFPVHDVAALYQAMYRLAEDSALRARLGKQARHDYTTQFDFARIIKDRIIPLYENA